MFDVLYQLLQLEMQVQPDYVLSDSLAWTYALGAGMSMHILFVSVLVHVNLPDCLLSL
jgi:hypothetical protein